jgi:hypothetical protein
MRMMNALSFTPPMACKAMDYIHTWLNKWRMQGNFQEKRVMVSIPGGELQRAGEDRSNTWTLGGIAIR